MRVRAHGPRGRALLQAGASDQPTLAKPATLTECRLSSLARETVANRGSPIRHQLLRSRGVPAAGTLCPARSDTGEKRHMAARATCVQRRKIHSGDPAWSSKPCPDPETPSTAESATDG